MQAVSINAARPVAGLPEILAEVKQGRPVTIRSSRIVPDFVRQRITLLDSLFQGTADLVLVA
jgi:hypothetical protein